MELVRDKFVPESRFCALYQANSPTSSSPPSMACIHDLPNEILYKIIEYSSLDELVSLAQTSRRLNSIAIPQFLKLHDIPEPTQCFLALFECGIVSRTDPLAGLSIGFDIRSID